MEWRDAGSYRSTGIDRSGTYGFSDLEDTNHWVEAKRLWIVKISMPIQTPL